MKTPEELAEGYTKDWWGNLPEAEGMRKSAKENFLAGYKAAQEQLAGVSKVMDSLETPDSCEHILDMEKMVDVSTSATLNNWVSVKDRLPETEEYLTIGYIDGTPWLHHCAVYSAKDGKWMRTERPFPKDITDFVKYWMPLPKPPKEEG